MIVYATFFKAFQMIPWYNGVFRCIFEVKWQKSALNTVAPHTSSYFYTLLLTKHNTHTFQDSHTKRGVICVSSRLVSTGQRFDGAQGEELDKQKDSRIHWGRGAQLVWFHLQQSSRSVSAREYSSRRSYCKSDS